MNKAHDCFCACSSMLGGSVCWLVCLDQVTRSLCTFKGPALWEHILLPQESDQCNEMLIQVWPESVSFIVNSTSKQQCGEPANQDMMKKKMLIVVLPHWEQTVMIFWQCSLCSCEMIEGMVHSIQFIYSPFKVHKFFFKCSPFVFHGLEEWHKSE